jgi:hypothetical protein
MPRKVRRFPPIVLGPDANDRPFARARVDRAILSSGVSVAVDDKLLDALADVCLHRVAGVRCGKRGVSDEAVANQVLCAGVMGALVNAGHGTSRWSQRDTIGDPSAIAESKTYTLIRALAREFGFPLPVSLKHLAREASHIAISPVRSA